MKEKEIKEELELCIRSFLEAEERAEKESLDNFDELRILEAGFNRLFMSAEHLCNAIMLFEKGNFSKKHFGDFTKLKEFKEKYKPDLSEIYQETYSLRSYGDYRKFEEVKDKFNREELKSKISLVRKAIQNSLSVIATKIDIADLLQKLSKEESKQ